MKNAIEQLKDRIAGTLPDATLVLQAPRPVRPTAAWWLEAQRGEHHVTVEWKPRRGFGVTSPAEGFGEGADEAYDDVGETADRVIALLREKGRTQTPAEKALDALRRQRQISQADLAAALDMRQGSVSKALRRTDMHVSTLRKVVHAMGGRLKLVAEFPDQPAVEITDVGKAGG